MRLPGSSATAAPTTIWPVNRPRNSGASVKVRSVSRTFTEAPLFLGLFTGQIVVGAAVALLPGNLISLLINAYVLNGLITPVILAFLVVLTSRRRLLGAAANPPLLRAVATAVVAVVSVLSTVVLVQTVLGWLGIG